MSTRDSSPNRQINVPMKWVIPNAYLEPGPWFGGKPAGRIYEEKTFWRVRICNRNDKICKYFSFSKTVPRESARGMADDWRIEKSLSMELTRNRLRMLSNSVVEMQLTQGYSQIFDIDDLSLLQGYKWYAHRSGRGYIKALTKLEKKTNRTTAQLLFGQKMDHINPFCDSDGLDNRRENLRPADYTINNNNRRISNNNKTGINGVRHYHENGAEFWMTIWVENGAAKQKRFKVTTEVNTESARQMAIDLRNTMDLRTGCTNGKRPKRIP
jgi:hypothetical protein